VHGSSIDLHRQEDRGKKKCIVVERRTKIGKEFDVNRQYSGRTTGIVCNQSIHSFNHSLDFTFSITKFERTHRHLHPLNKQETTSIMDTAASSSKTTAAAVVHQAEEEDGTGMNAGEFVVHTKHTCDKCFQRPILGRRYTSSNNSNFDLCARCFETYTGPEIGLTETALGKDFRMITNNLYLRTHSPIIHYPFHSFHSP
jgi:hypothetical protein